MSKSTCDNCGAPLFAKYKTGSKQYCSKVCYHQSLCEKPSDGNSRSRYIHPEGWANLMCAVVRRAREDIMHYSPGTYLRIDAERFFSSGDCESMTGLDGKKILAQIHEECNRGHRKGAMYYDAE